MEACMCMLSSSPSNFFSLCLCKGEGLGLDPEMEVERGRTAKWWAQVWWGAHIPLTICHVTALKHSLKVK